MGTSSSQATPSAGCSTGCRTARWRSRPRWGLHRPPHPTECGALAAVGVLARSAGLWPDAVRGGRGLARPAHPGRPCRRGDAPVPTDWVEAHPDAPFSFVTDGVEAAIARAQELAEDRAVAVAGGTIARQCLDLGLLDEVAVDLVPVV